MMRIDIGVTVLLTVRMVVFRPALPQLLDPNNEAWLPGRKDEQQECLFVGNAGVNEHYSRKYRRASFIALGAPGSATIASEVEAG